jgi:ATP-binding cassette subfamily B protein RaxB
MTDQLNLGLLPKPRLRHVRQTEVAECGLACLTMIAGYHGLHVDMAIMRQKFVQSARGASLRSVMKIAEQLNLTPRAVRVDLEDLDSLLLPAMLHWDMNHYVVIEKTSRKRALIHDPNGQSDWLHISEVSKHFTGVALELTPTSDFEVGHVQQRIKLSSLWTHVRGVRRAACQTVLLSLVLQVFAIASPYYFQLAIDSALPDLNVGFLSVLAIGFGLFSVLNGISTLIRSSVLLAIGSSFSYGLSSNVARKLFRLPVDWFSRRQVGDILSRFQSVIPIRNLLTEDAPVVMIDGVMAVSTLIIMFIYSTLLSALTVTALLIYIAFRIALFRPQRSAQEEVIAAMSREQSVLIESMNGIRALRLAGRESLRHAVWQARMTDAVNGNIRFQRLVNWQNALQTTLLTIENVVSIWFAVAAIIRGGFSVGMVIAFLAYKTQFLNASISLINKASEFKMLGLHLERLSDIALASDDVSFQANLDLRADTRGAIELRDIYFRYGVDDPFVLRGVNLKVEPGESLVITGPSGGGKSTLLQILLGLVEPTGGEVLIDGIPIHRFGYKSYHAQVAAVLQDDTLFGGSLNDNISLFDDEPDLSKVKECAVTADIDEDISRMPMGYETLVGEMGSALSGGQKQRVLLARALYRKPRILVMDEGTSHLDEGRERKVNQAISGMGITRIIVAHRKETIASAQRIYVLENGVLEERLT